jgi:prophage antirepressor-like protein
MNTNIQIFENPQFGKIRIVMSERGEPMFAGIDVATALGYTDTDQAIRVHVDKDDKKLIQLSDIQDPLNPTPSHMKGSKVMVISEAGLYDLVFGSTLESAKDFKRWVTHEVLPSIRKTGMYATPATIDAIIADPEFGIKLLSSLKEERQKRELAEEKKEELQLQVESKQKELQEAAPKINWYEENQRSIGLHTMTVCVEKLSISPGYMNKVLIRYKVIRETGGEYSFLSRYQNKGFGEQVPIAAGVHSDGTPRTRLELRYYEKGRKLIHDVFNHAAKDGFITKKKDGRWVIAKNYGYTEFNYKQFTA